MVQWECLKLEIGVDRTYIFQTRIESSPEKIFSNRIEPKIFEVKPNRTYDIEKSK